MISFILTLIIFLINGASVLRFYQIKDYLLKRARAHFYLPSSKRLVFNFKEYFLYFFYFLSLFLTLNQNKFVLEQFFLEIFKRIDFLIFLLILFFALRFNFLKRIHFTPKVIIVTFLAFSINFSFLYFSHNHPLIFFVLSLWLSQFIVFTLAILIFDFCVKPYLNYLGKKVKEKLEKDHLKIVGFVGSYGKSSTKEILHQLMKGDFKVLSLPPRINHEYAILKYLLKVDLKNYEYLLVEFGSYYLGNIRWITKYVTPDFLFVTGITKQHLFLFGNIENIIQGEGIEGMIWMKEGIVFVNVNHEYFEKLKDKIEKLNKNLKIITYAPHQSKLDSGQGFYKKETICYTYEILENDLEKTKFRLKTKNKIYEFETNLIFPMQVENLVGCLIFLDQISALEKYQEKIKNIELPEGFLKLKRKENLYIFDDSYNANLKGVFEAIKFFKNSNFNYKVIIFNGIFELGKETKEIYKNLAKEFDNFDEIILSFDDYFEIFKEVLKNKVRVVKDKKELKNFLQGLKYPQVGIWIFNRLPEKLTPLPV